jgi:glycosyltransferase involved in cell wall biosynthesis
MNKVSVGVVVTTCDRHQDLASALKSLLEQVMLPDEVVVVDDCSAVPVLPSIFSGFPATVKCKLISNEIRMGGNFSRNVGISAVESMLTLFLDDDDKFIPEKINIITAEFKGGEFDVVYHPAVINYVDYNVSYISDPVKEVDVTRLLCSNCIGATSMVGIKTELAKNKIIFDERFPALQDWDAWLSLAVSGARFKYISTPLTSYTVKVSDRSVSKSVRKQAIAVELMEEKYKSFLSCLSSDDVKCRKLNIFSLFFLKGVLSRDRACSFRYALRLLLNGAGVKFMLAFFVSIFSLKVCVSYRARRVHRYN